MALIDGEGRDRGALTLTTLPGRDPSALRDRIHDPDRHDADAVVQVREGQTYVFDLQLDTDAAVRIHPSELFEPEASGRHGRFSPAQAVGHLEVVVEAADGTAIGSTAVDVRAAKLEHETEYRQMLRDIAGHAAEAVLQGFQPSAESFRISDRTPAELLYQQFALLYDWLFDPEFEAAVVHVLSSPHRSWRDDVEWRSPNRSLGGGARLRQSLVRDQPRQRWDTPPPHMRLRDLPRSVRVERSVETVDTIPNRLVKFVFTTWRAMVVDVERAVRGSDTGAAQRGRRDVARALDRLDTWLAAPLFREVSQLTTYPVGNQVLLKRDGYRQIFAAWALTGSGIDVAIDLEDPLRISQRNVATLYEYWVFLELAAILGELCGTRADPPFAVVSSGLALGLQKGTASKMEWFVKRDGRTLELELYFNRTFSATAPDGSWSRAMVPDCSLLLRPVTGVPHDAEQLEMWVHFDAKYRVENLVSQFGTPPQTDDEIAVAAEEAESLGESKRADLLKMHAYRDAIRRSGGAFVIFPGDAKAEARFPARSELLPSIGALPLRPGGPELRPQGADGIRAFLEELLDHVADQASQHERARFWDDRIYTASPATPFGRPVDFLARPPADTLVLVRRVDNIQLRWIHDRRLVDVPGDDVDLLTQLGPDALSAELIVLIGALGSPILLRRASVWFPVDRAWMRRMGRPTRVPERFLCCNVEAVEGAPSWLGRLDERRLSGGGRDDVYLVSWLDVLGAVS